MSSSILKQSRPSCRTSESHDRSHDTHMIRSSCSPTNKLALWENLKILSKRRRLVEDPVYNYCCFEGRFCTCGCQRVCHCNDDGICASATQRPRRSNGPGPTEGRLYTAKQIILCDEHLFCAMNTIIIVVSLSLSLL